MSLPTLESSTRFDGQLATMRGLMSSLSVRLDDRVTPRPGWLMSLMAGRMLEAWLSSAEVLRLNLSSNLECACLATLNSKVKAKRRILCGGLESSCGQLAGKAKWLLVPVGGEWPALPTHKLKLT